MKKIIFIAFLSLALLASCGQTTKSDAQAKTDSSKRLRTTLYDKDGISFDVPNAWQENFKAVTREVGGSGNTYPQTDFYYTKNGRDIRVMSIGKFTREQWESIKKTEKNAENAMLGETGDKKNVYSIFYENHDYIQDEDLKKTVTGIKTEAEKIRDKIAIR